MNKQTKLRNLIQETKGKFFSIKFVKNDGSLRVANGKDIYNRLLAPAGSPRAGKNTVSGAGYESFVDRNKEGWIAAHGEKVVSFKCGKLEVNF
jgi:hypothetical protein